MRHTTTNLTTPNPILDNAPYATIDLQGSSFRLELGQAVEITSSGRRLPIRGTCLAADRQSALIMLHWPEPKLRSRQTAAATASSGDDQ